jgi:riboflavin synthase
MFTGIVEELGKVERLHNGVLRINAKRIMDDLEVKDSVCINGACLTVTSKNENGFEVDIVPETLRRTDLGDLLQGDEVNLERSTKMGGRLGGHIVQGHVDGIGVISSVKDDEGYEIYEFTLPTIGISRYIVEKGFICVDGISLTVVSCDATSFSIALIPYTCSHTVLGTKHVGGSVNLEVDIIAKYVEKLSNGDASLELS